MTLIHMFGSIKYIPARCSNGSIAFPAGTVAVTKTKRINEVECHRAFCKTLN
jgi:hypothetical protein